MADKMSDVVTCKIPLVTSIAIRILHQTNGWKICKIAKKFPKFARRSINRHAKLTIPTDDSQLVDGRKNNSGRPRIISARDERKIIQSLHSLRKQSGISFTSFQIKKEAGLNGISNRTVRHYLNKNNYYYRHLRKKGLVTAKDRVNRVKFARTVTNKLQQNFFTQGISFYFDGVGFVHKTNPWYASQNNSTMGYRLKNEGLQLTSKGKKEGVNGKMAHFFVAICYGQGVVLCEQFHEKLNGENFGNFVEKYFPDAFKKSANPKGKLFLQDGDPTQKSRKAKLAYDKVGCRRFSIPARSPDINPIENFFHNARRQLSRDALSRNIEKETYEEFCERVKNTMLNYPVHLLDKTIETMPKRMKEIIKNKGYRTKY